MTDATATQAAPPHRLALVFILLTVTLDAIGIGLIGNHSRVGGIAEML